MFSSLATQKGEKTSILTHPSHKEEEWGKKSQTNKKKSQKWRSHDTLREEEKERESRLYYGQYQQNKITLSSILDFKGQASYQ